MAGAGLCLSGSGIGTWMCLVYIRAKSHVSSSDLTAFSGCISWLIHSVFSDIGVEKYIFASQSCVYML